MRRIVSLVPSQTELLYDLGLGDHVVGITKFCVHPATWFQTKTRVGGTKTVNIQKVIALQPDLILANKEENDREQVETLAKHYPVWVSDIKNLTDALAMIVEIGRLTDTAIPAATLIADIKNRFRELNPGKAAHIFDHHPLVHPLPLRRAAYLIWRKPYMVAGGDTFIQDMLLWAGFENVFGDQLRYPETNLEALAALRPEVILLSSEPYPFAEKHIETIQEACPTAQVQLVDGTMFSWYGSRLLQAAPYFRLL